MASIGYVWSSLGTSTSCYLDVATNGVSALLVAAALPNFTQTGVLAAIMLKTKEEKVRTIAMPAFISSIFGVTEPAIYGVTLPMRIPFYISCLVSGFIGSATMMLNIKQYAVGAMGIFQYPANVDPSTGDMTGMWWLIALTVIAIVASFIIQMIAPVPYLYGGPKDESATTDKK